MHDKAEVDLECKTEKPYVVLDHNSTQEAVDCFLQQITNSSCARKTNRCPMRLFFILTYTACHNPCVGFAAIKSNVAKLCASRQLDKRRMFLVEAGEQLVTPLMKLQASNPNIGRRPSMSSFDIELDENSMFPSSAEIKFLRVSASNQNAVRAN
jgi:hypothetical protein